TYDDNITHAGSFSDSELPAAHFPAAAKGDPERQGNQPQVEPERLPIDVEPIVSELLAARNVARRVDLGHPGEPGYDAVPFHVTRNVLERALTAIARHFDLAGSQGPGAHETHVAHEDAPELRQLVHRGGPQPPAHPRDTRIVVGGLQRPDPGFGILNHRAELVHPEHAAVPAGALLPVEHVAAILEFHGQRGNDPD